MGKKLALMQYNLQIVKTAWNRNKDAVPNMWP
jgi:hypothetical protein